METVEELRMTYPPVNYSDRNDDHYYRPGELVYDDGEHIVVEVTVSGKNWRAHGIDPCVVGYSIKKCPRKCENPAAACGNRMYYDVEKKYCMFREGVPCEK